MKLINFDEFSFFIEMKKMMGIPKKYKPDYSPKNHSFDSTDWEDIETVLTGGELGKEPGTGSILYEGEKIALYIRDYSPYRQPEPPDPKNWLSPYKYHVAWCSVLETKKRNGTYEKYVGTKHTDELFLVNLIWNNKVIASQKQKLAVCKKCLERLNYKGYANTTKEQRSTIFNEFSLEKYLLKNTPNFHIEPKYYEDEAKPNVYHESFSEISSKLKELKKYRCEKCGAICMADHGLLDVHHINGIKSDNSPSNLIVLCIGCHADIHEHLKNSQRWEYWIKNKSKAIIIRKRKLIL